MFKTFTLLFTLVSLTCSAQSLTSHREELEKANAALAGDFKKFNTSLRTANLKESKDSLISLADNPYKKYLVGGMLYSIDPSSSLKLHEEAFLTDKNNLEFSLEYALELHRKGRFLEASKLYEQYAKVTPGDFRAQAWLADCYINLGEITKSLDAWKKSNSAKNHTGIDFAIYAVYGDTAQLNIRDNLRQSVKAGDLLQFYSLIHADLNWRIDWWNSDIYRDFLTEDLTLAKSLLGETSKDYKVLKAYSEIKELLKNGEGAEQLKTMLVDNNLILNNSPFPIHGGVTSDLLNACFIKGLISEKEFYDKRGRELLELARRNRDKDLLNIYAYLQATVLGKVDPEIDKMGWTEMHDERFAQSYFIGRGGAVKYNDPELKQAMANFPDAAYLFWLKAYCAKKEGLPVKPHLVDMIIREFKTLSTSEGRFCDKLNSYFATLSAESK